MKLYTGVVEDILDPLKSGRVRVRVFGLHTDDKTLIPTEKLMWASVMLPVTSASVSGIGLSPTGMVNGSWVIVYFYDTDEQYPIVLGTIPAIPKDNMNQTSEEETSFGSITDVVPTNQTPPDQTEKSVPIPETATPSGARKTTEFAFSDSGKQLLMDLESFSAKAYKDSGGVWTVGYGSTTVDGVPVTSETVITKDKALSELVNHINKHVAPVIKSKVKVVITQQMYDALVIFSYNVGSGAFSGSTLLKNLNTEKYKDAAANFNDWIFVGGKESNGLKNRRNKEKALFLSGGIPDSSGDVSDVPTQDTTTNTDSTTSVDDNGTVTYNTNLIGKNLGFKDPDGIYPKYYNEPDVHKLARHQDIKKTVVFKKEAARELEVPIANSEYVWDQPPIPYNAEYPFNNVMVTKSGHIQEFDDTPDARRIHTYHASGTYNEIDDNGTNVRRIVGESYEIIERDGYLHIKGNNHICIDGNHSLLIQNASSIEVVGTCNITIHNSAALNVSGNLDIGVGGDLNIKAANNINMDAKFIFQNSNTTTNILPGEIKATKPVIFKPLKQVKRGEESAMNYEAPEDGDPSQSIADRIDKGEVTREELESTNNPDVQEKYDDSETPKQTPEVIEASCDTFKTMTDFSTSIKLSNNFTLGKLNKNGTRKLTEFKGVQPATIACNLKQLCENILERIYTKYPNMIITSGYRRYGDVPASAKNSDHYYGYAVDIQIPGFARKDYYNYAKELVQTVPYDRILLEYNGSSTWIHISYKGSANRKEIFTMNNHARISKFGEFVLV